MPQLRPYVEGQVASALRFPWAVQGQVGILLGRKDIISKKYLFTSLAASGEGMVEGSLSGQHFIHYLQSSHHHSFWPFTKEHIQLGFRNELVLVRVGGLRNQNGGSFV